MRNLFIFIFHFLSVASVHAQSNAISVGASDQSIPCESIIEVPIHASRFQKILSMQGTVMWDTAVLRFDSIGNYGPAALGLQPAQFGLTQTGSGRIFFSWNDPSLAGVSLPDSGRLFTLRFTVRATGPVTAKVIVGGDVVPLEFVDTSYKPLTVSGDTGVISLPFQISGYDPFPDTSRVCGLNTTLDAGSGFSAYNWSNGVVGATALITADGLYKASVRNALGCVGRDSTYVSLVQADILQADTTICKGSSLSLQARTGPGWQYGWTPSGNTASLTVTPLIDNVYRLTVTNGITTCRDSVRINVSVIDTSLTVTNNLIFCAAQDSVVMSAGIASSYRWLRNGIPIPGALKQRFVADSSGSYRVVLRNALGCEDSSRAILVTVHPQPIALLRNPGDSLLCQGGTSLLIASGGVSYRWYRNDTLVVSSSRDSLTITQPGRYAVQVVSDQGCIRRADSTFTLSLVMRPVLAFDITGICVDVPIQFSNRSTSVHPASSAWRWTFGDGRSDTAFKPQNTYRDTGTYSVLLRYRNARCPTHADSLARSLTVIRAANVRFTDVIALKGVAKTLRARDTATSWLWTPATGLSMTTIYNPTAILQQAQAYIIRAALKNGCIVSDSLLVKVANETNIHVPKAFSPNGDGRNDLLYPILVGIDELRYFRVYNRWGNLVYELKGVQSNIGWDGRYRGMVQPMEGYVWVAEAVDVLGKTIKAKGNTLLIR